MSAVSQKNDALWNKDDGVLKNIGNLRSKATNKALGIVDRWPIITGIALIAISTLLVLSAFGVIHLPLIGAAMGGMPVGVTLITPIMLGAGGVGVVLTKLMSLKPEWAQTMIKVQAVVKLVLLLGTLSLFAVPAFTCSPMIFVGVLLVGGFTISGYILDVVESFRRRAKEKPTNLEKQQKRALERSSRNAEVQSAQRDSQSKLETNKKAQVKAFSKSELSRKKMDRNEQLLAFYEKGERVQLKGGQKSLAEIRHFDSDEMENQHDYIHWLFPTDDKKNYTSGGPVLDQKTFDKLNRSQEFKEELLNSFDQMLGFFGLVRENGEVVLDASLEEELGARLKNWLEPVDGKTNHNQDRITRILVCLKLFGLNKEALQFYNCLVRIYNSEGNNDTKKAYITTQMMKTWRKAVKVELKKS